MPRELTVYGGILPRDSRFDPADISGRRQVRAVVATYTKKRAIELMGVTPTYFRDFVSATFNPTEVEVCRNDPEQLYVTSADWGNRTYHKSWRIAHVPFRRGS